VSGERRNPNVRQRALRLLEEGKSSTVRYWRHAAGQAGPPSGEDPASWAERKRTSAEAAHGVAVQALVEVRNLLSADRVREAKDAALTFAILSDMSGVLEQTAERAAEQEVRLAQAHAEQLVEVVCAFLDALGVPFEALLDADSFEDLPGKWQAAILEAEQNRPKLRLVSDE
jgi:hypothetical protein